MPPIRSLASRLRIYCAENPSLSVKERVLFRTVRQEQFSHDKTHVTRHLQTQKHNKNEKLKREKQNSS